ncbi:transcriptional regulator of MarR family [alpha proteobacterium U9-1i]|nr:transcriptional regulator of MarR family [alpha proteobacterium U9-1i]
MSIRKSNAKPDPLQAFAAAAMPKCLCMNMRLATRRLVALYEARLAASGLNISQFGIMASVAAEPDMTMTRLAARLELSPSTLTRTLRPLEDLKLLEMAADDRNRRVRRVKLSAEGRKKLKRAGAAWAQAQAEAEEIVPPKLVDALMGATARLPG